MTKKVALLTVHGMGETQSGYADGLCHSLKTRLGDRWEDVSVHTVYYQQSLQDNEESVWKAVDAQAKVHYDELRRFLLFGFADAAGLENGKEEQDSAYVDAQVEIARNLLAARQALGGNGPVVVVSQSLGCQVFSSYLYDAQKQEAGGIPPGIWSNIDDPAFYTRIAGRLLKEEEKWFLRGKSVQRWVTTGCNIPIFVAAHKKMAIKPIAVPAEDQDFKWLNLYDPDDVLGWPLGPLSDEYKALVEDKAINSGRGAIGWIIKSWNPMSHTAYWADGDVLNPIENMLRQYL